MRSLVFLVGTLGGLGLALSAATTMIGLLVFSLMQSDSEGAAFAAWSAASSVGIGIALLPGCFAAFRSILGRADPAPRPLPPFWVAFLLPLPVGLWLGDSAFRSGGVVGQIILGPFAHVLTALAAVGTVVSLILRRGPPVSLKRAAASFSMGVTAIPLLAIAAEALVLVPTSILGAAWLLSTPEGVELVRSLMTLGSDPSALSSSYLAGWLQQPLVVAAVFAFTAGVVPVIEELTKTAAVWPWLRRRLTPGEGFLLGALGGAGYGLFEALFLSQPGPEWAATAIGRVGATFMHAATAGITGWGFTGWARDRRWIRALMAYGVAVLGHAAWNLAALSAGYETILRQAEQGSGVGTWPPYMGIASVVVLVSLSLTAIVLILRRSRTSTPPG